MSIWHSRLGHPSPIRLKSLISDGLLRIVKSDSFECMPCQLTKQSALSLNKSDSHALPPFDLVHSDVWGPALVSTMGGSHYFVIFIDIFFRYTWIYLLKSCSELLSIFREFNAMVQTQFSKTI